MLLTLFFFLLCCFFCSFFLLCCLFFVLFSIVLPLLFFSIVLLLSLFALLYCYFCSSFFSFSILFFQTLSAVFLYYLQAFMLTKTLNVLDNRLCHMCKYVKVQFMSQKLLYTTDLCLKIDNCLPFILFMFRGCEKFDLERF